eukprot:7257478-Lingulodinium_polyedra.AAC.1
MAETQSPLQRQSPHSSRTRHGPAEPRGALPRQSASCVAPTSTANTTARIDLLHANVRAGSV